MNQTFSIKIIQNIRANIDLWLLFIFCVFVFNYLIHFVPTDITEHLDHIRKINANQATYPANFAFYWIANFLSRFLNLFVHKSLNISAIILLSVASVMKYAISKKIIESNTRITDKLSGKSITLITISLFFCFAIPDPFSLFVLKKYYLSRFAPLVWHNSTTIFFFPFAIMLFWRQIKVLNSSYQSTVNDILILNCLVLANIVIKPSFIFVYIPVTFFFLLNKFRTFFSRAFLLNLTPLITGGLVIVLQTYLLYAMELGSFQKEDSHISLGEPFKILSCFIPMWYIPISFVLSFTLPIFTAVAYKAILAYKPFLYASFLMITGILISAFVYETGPRMYHGNFLWQNVICAYLVFLSVVAFMANKIIDKGSWTTIDKIFIGLFGLHTFSGIVYLIIIISRLSYY
jgi:hypothetical protein